jgi:hypothetical protein
LQKIENYDVREVSTHTRRELAAPKLRRLVARFDPRSILVGLEADRAGFLYPFSFQRVKSCPCA